jgi:hypothetical protein
LAFFHLLFITTSGIDVKKSIITLLESVDVAIRKSASPIVSFILLTEPAISTLLTVSRFLNRFCISSKVSSTTIANSDSELKSSISETFALALNISSSNETKKPIQS